MYYLYRYYDRQNRLLYVGITKNTFAKRHRQHERAPYQKEGRWIGEVEYSLVSSCNTEHKKEAEMLESVTIKIEQPIYNTVHYQGTLTTKQKENLHHKTGDVLAPMPVESIQKIIKRHPVELRADFVFVGLDSAGSSWFRYAELEGRGFNTKQLLPEWVAKAASHER